METNNIYEVLNYIQQKLNVKKSKSVQIGGANGKMFKYRTAEGIFESLKPLLADTKSTLTITTDFIEIGGNIYCKAKATLFYKSETGVQTISTNAFAREGTNDLAEKEWKEQDRYKGEVRIKTQTSLDQIKGGQSSGAAISYATKYALCGLFLIDDGIDADSLFSESEQPKTKDKPAEIYAKDITKFIEEGNLRRAENGIAYLKKSFPSFNTITLENLLKVKQNG